MKNDETYKFSSNWLSFCFGAFSLKSSPEIGISNLFPIYQNLKLFFEKRIDYMDAYINVSSIF